MPYLLVQALHLFPAHLPNDIPFLIILAVALARLARLARLGHFNFDEKGDKLIAHLIHPNELMPLDLWKIAGV